MGFYFFIFDEVHMVMLLKQPHPPLAFCCTEERERNVYGVIKDLSYFMDVNGIREGVLNATVQKSESVQIHGFCDIFI